MATVLNLTPAESQVAVALAEGHTVHDIAVMTHRQESSVRWLLKQIYAKTGLRRQADLVADGAVAGVKPAGPDR